MDINKTLLNWMSNTKLSDDKILLAKQRLLICTDCTSLIEKPDINGINSFYCGECGCPLKKNIFIPNSKSCNLNKW